MWGMCGKWSSRARLFIQRILDEFDGFDGSDIDQRGSEQHAFRRIGDAYVYDGIEIARSKITPSFHYLFHLCHTSLENSLWKTYKATAYLADSCIRNTTNDEDASLPHHDIFVCGRSRSCYINHSSKGTESSEVRYIDAGVYYHFGADP